MTLFFKLFQVLALAGGLKSATGSVIYTEIPTSINDGNYPFHSIYYDLNKDGRSDFSLTATADMSGSRYVIVRAPMGTRFFYLGFESDLRPSGFNARDFSPLGGDSLIGDFGETATFRLLNLSDSFVRRLATIQDNPGTFPGHGLFVGETAYLGFSFQSDLGTHYGYALLTDTTFQGTTILATCRRLSKSGFNCLSKSGQVFLIFMAS